MAVPRYDREPVWPAKFATWDPELYPDEWTWFYERAKWARDQGYKQFKLLPFIQHLARVSDIADGGWCGCGYCRAKDNETR